MFLVEGAAPHLHAGPTEQIERRQVWLLLRAGPAPGRVVRACPPRAHLRVVGGGNLRIASRIIYFSYAEMGFAGLTSSLVDL